MSLRTNLVTTRKCFIFNILKRLRLKHNITRIRIQIRKIYGEKNSKQDLDNKTRTDHYAIDKLH